MTERGQSDVRAARRSVCRAVGGLRGLGRGQRGEPGAYDGVGRPRIVRARVRIAGSGHITSRLGDAADVVEKRASLLARRSLFETSAAALVRVVERARFEQAMT